MNHPFVSPGTWQFHPLPLFDFQLNRLVMWNHGDPEQIKQSEVYKDCPAVTSDQLVAVDFSAMRLRGLPMIEELAKMARAAYPQAYGK